MNTETDRLRDIILDTWANELRCYNCCTLIGRSNKFTATQYEMICNDCFMRLLD